MSGKFAKIFFDSLFSRIDDKQALIDMDKEIAADIKVTLMHRALSMRILSDFVYAVNDALKQHIDGEKPQSKNKQALYYMKKQAGSEAVTVAETLFAETTQLLAAVSHEAVLKSGAELAYKTLHDGV
jgi:hypothetical protein